MGALAPAGSASLVDLSLDPRPNTAQLCNFEHICSNSLNLSILICKLRVPTVSYPIKLIQELK